MIKRHIRYGTCVVILLNVLGGCSSSNAEQFVDARQYGSSQYQQIADEIMADGKVTRSEAEQAIEANVSCYEEQNLAGIYAYDLDEYYWFTGDIQLGKRHPDFSYNPHPETEEGRRISDRIQHAMDKSLAQCDPVFQPVREYLSAHADWGHNSKQKYIGVKQCLSNADPTADKKFVYDEDRIDIAADIDNIISDYEQAIIDMATYYNQQPVGTFTKQQRKAISDCINYGSAVPLSYGEVPPELEDTDGPSK